MKNNGHQARLIVVSCFFLLVLGALLWRMLDLTVLHRQFLQGQGDARSLRVIDIPAHRGMITDRQGIPLAVSTPVQSVWINPKTFNPTLRQLTELCRLLNISPRHLRSSVGQARNREFLYLQRQLPPPLTKKIRRT